MADRTIAWSTARSRSAPTNRGSRTMRRTDTSCQSACRASGSRNTGANSTTATTGFVTGSSRGRKELGIVPADTTLAPWPEVLPSWDDLTDLDKKIGGRWMEVFCAAVEHTDYQVGRIIEAIQQTGDLDNTLILYIAGDNGPTPEGGLHGVMNKLTYYKGVQESLEDVASRMDDFGGELPRLLSRRLGYATSTPFNYGKMVTSGGGCSTAVAFSWPARIKQGGRRRQFHHLIDIEPDRAESYNTRWNALKSEFVDDPRGAVQGANGLVGEVLDELEELFRRQRADLEHGLDSEQTSTEDLRQALGRYRSFFDRLLSL
jgi:hypothetical protein